MFQLSNEELDQLGAGITVREIKQQPELWQEALDYFKNEQDRIQLFMKRLTERHSRLRVIFSGAGSSAYVGDTILPYLKEHGNEKQFDFQAVPTTHLVTNPKSYFKKDMPTILVSFARSGNSPESLASVQLGKDLVEDFYQITITCAPEGKLAQHAEGDNDNLLLMMPSRSNDQGFAMTGSFTCMTLTATLLFDQHSLDEKAAHVASIIEMSNDILKREDELNELLAADFDRIIYLGSGSLAGIAREVQLKILELTAGKIATAFDSSLGFRHGPKSFVNEKSLVFLFVSNERYTKQYDVDMLTELQGDQIAHTVCGVSVGDTNNDAKVSFVIDEKHNAVPDGYLALPYTVFGQMISMLAAVKVDNKPDTPSPTGTVNRVVKGVIIYDNLND